MGQLSQCAATTEPALCNKRSHRDKKHLYHQRGAPACHNQRKPKHSNEDPAQPNKPIKKLKKSSYELLSSMLYHKISSKIQTMNQKQVFYCAQYIKQENHVHNTLNKSIYPSMDTHILVKVYKYNGNNYQIHERAKERNSIR